MAKDGIHAVLVVVSLSSRISLEEAATVETLQKLFGDKITKYMIMVFTGGDDFEEDEVNFDDYLSRSESIKVGVLSDLVILMNLSLTILWSVLLCIRSNFVPFAYEVIPVFLELSH